MEMQAAIRLQDLTVGYGGSPVISGIDVDFLRGKMTCLLGSNGAGKTTMLKTIAGIIPGLHGQVFIGERPLPEIRHADLAKEMAMVLTNKIDIENLTGFEVAAMGRYPHTGFFGRLDKRDVEIVDKYLALCSAMGLREKYFCEMSDGEKQKIMLARGLSQESDILMLDEPTSHLDIKHKLDLLQLLRKLCLEEGRTILCTLHEPDLAVKCCDYLVLVQGDRVLCAGETEQIVASGQLDRLYGFSQHQFNPYLGMIEFPNPGTQDVYLIGSDERTPVLLRNLNKAFLGVGIGVLQQNDVSSHIAATMGIPVDTVPAYTPVSDKDVEQALAHASAYRQIWMADCPRCALNEKNWLLAEKLRQQGRDVLPLAGMELEEVLRLARGGKEDAQ